MSAYADRAMETSTSTGTGDLTLDGAVTAHQTLNAGVGTGISFDYSVVAVDGSGSPTGEWEVGVGHLSASTTLVRTKPTKGSAATPVNFSAGTKRVFITYSAAQAVPKNKMLAMAMNTAWT